MSSFKLPTDAAGLLAMAKLAEQCERYDEMLVCMKRFVKLQPVLSAEEKNLLSVAYKNVIGVRRTPLRAVAALEGRAEKNTSMAELIKGFKARLEQEITEVCDDLVALLEQFLIPKAQDDDAKVFYYKLKGDYHRYAVEATPSPKQLQAATEAYQKGMTVAENLAVASPARLGLALNFSVFHYENLKQQEQGYDLAKKAFYAALEEIEGLPDDEYSEAATLMSLLRDNLSTWSETLGKDQEQDDGTAVEDM